MPTYEYACKSCGQHLDVVQSFSDDPLTECPNCGGQLRKVFGNIGISFKGSGFYKNDSRSTSSSSSTPSSTTGSSDSHDHGHGHDHSHSESAAPAKTETTKTEAAKKEPAKKETASSAS